MSFKLACSDYTFPLLPHENTFDLISMLGFQGIDIGLFEDRSHLQPKHLIPNLASAARELSQKIADRGLEFADIFYQSSSFQTMAANDPDPKERGKSRDFFLRMLEFTVRCNAKHMTGLPGVDWESESNETSLKRCAEELAWRAEQARQVGVVYSVEAHVGSVAPTPAQAQHLVEMAPGLTLTLDYTHFIRQGYSDNDVEPLIQYAGHFHARGARKERLQASFKENVIDYARILRVMKSVNFPGWIGVEYVWTEWEHCNEVDNISETIQLRDYLKSIQS